MNDFRDEGFSSHARDSAGPKWATPTPLLLSMSDSTQKVVSLDESRARDNLQIYSTSSVSGPATADAFSGPQFRLLQLKPNTPGQSIHCTLIRRPVFDAPKYIALSYSWEQFSHLSQIFIGHDRTSFSVSAHFKGALLHLRDERKLVTVWVDAICINQHDYVERAAQVQIMAQIYNQADEGGIWLVDNDSFDDDHLPNPRLFLSLCQRHDPWWTRLWVVQECAYAKRCPIVMLGVQSMTLEDLVLATVHHEATSALDGGNHALFASHLALFRMPYDAWKAQAENNTYKLLLLQRLRDTARHQCTEPHDRVYAILSLVDGNEATQIHPDYQEPWPVLRAEVEDLSKRSPDWDFEQDRSLLETGRDKYLADLQSASRHGDTKVIRGLLTSAPYNVDVYLGKALHAASGAGEIMIVELLLEKNANLITEGHDYNALHAASFGGHADIVQLLLEKGADVNAYFGRRGNALQTASKGGSTEVVQLLLDRGADVNAIGGADGKAPISMQREECTAAHLELHQVMQRSKNCCG